MYLCTIKIPKTEKEHLLKKVQQLSADKSESEEELQKEMELYKNYFKIDQVNKDHLMEYHMKIIQIMKLVVMKK